MRCRTDLFINENALQLWVRVIVTIAAAAFYGCILISAAIAKAAVQIRVDATTRLQINGVDRVQDGLFGLDGLSGGQLKYLETANMHTQTGNSAGIAGVQEDPNRPGQLDEKKLAEMLDAATPTKEGYRIDHFLHCLQSGPGWQSEPRERKGYIIPHDLEVYSQWAETVIRHRFKTMPETEHYFQFFGEISLMGYWDSPEILRDPRRASTNCNGRRAAERLVNVIKATHARLHQVGLEARLGTPGLTTSPQWADWRTWRNWWELMIDQVGDKVEFYGSHWYDMTQDNLKIEAGLIQNAQEIRWGNRKPICCQESDYSQGPMDEPLKGPYNAYFLWALLDMPDKVIVNTNHLRDLGGSYFHNMFRADRRLPKYWAFWIMRDLRGIMLTTHLTPNAAQPALPDRARGGRLWLFPQQRGIKARSAVSGQRLGTVIWNDSAHDDQVHLSIVLPRGPTPVKAELSYVFFDSHGPPKHESEHAVAPINFETGNGECSFSFLAKADTIYGLAVDFDQTIVPDNTAWSREVFGDQIMFHVPGLSRYNDVANPSPEAFKRLPTPELVIDPSLEGVKTARLRVALNKARGDWEDTLVHVNGQPYMLTVGQHVNRAALTEIPVDLDDLNNGRVRIRFHPHDAEPYQVLWASLVQSNQARDEPVAPVLVQLKDDGDGIIPGEPRTVQYVLTNKTPADISLKLRWMVPAGWSLDAADQVDLELPGGASRKGEVIVHAAGGKPIVSYEQIALVVEYPRGQVTARRSYKVNTPVPCRKFAEAPVIDGHLDEWQRHQDVELPVEDHTIQCWTGWDMNHFYIAAFIPATDGDPKSVTELYGIAGQDDVVGDKQKTARGHVPRSIRALHMFLDLGNEKGIYNYDANDHHFWFVTPGLVDLATADQRQIPTVPFPNGIELTEQQKKDQRWHPAYVDQTIWQGPLKKLEVENYPFTRMACQPAEDGYILEASIGGAWSWAWNEQAIYGYWPTAGQVIGFDFVIDDSNVGPLSPVTLWGRGYESLHRYYVTSPARTGIRQSGRVGIAAV